MESAEQAINLNLLKFPIGYLNALRYEILLVKDTPKNFETMERLFREVDWFPSKRDWLLSLFRLRTTIAKVSEGYCKIDEAGKALLDHEIKYPKDPIAHHEFGVFCYRIGATTSAINHLSKALEKNQERIETKYDLGLALLAKGDLKRGSVFYSYRWGLNETRFKTSIIPKNFGNRLSRDAKKGEKVVIFSEQGIGDQIRILPLAAQYALTTSAKVIFLCDKRFIEGFDSNIDNLELAAYEDADVFSREKYIDGYSLLGQYDVTDELFGLPRVSEILSLKSRNNYVITKFLSQISKVSKKLYGFTWWSSAWTGYSRSQIPIAPSIAQIAEVISVSHLADYVSLQYEAEKYKDELYNLEKKQLIYPPSEVDLKNDFQSIVSISSKLDLIVGPHSAQLLIAAISGAPVTGFIYQGDVLCLGNPYRDPLCPNLAFIQTKRVKTMQAFWPNILDPKDLT